MCETVPVHSDVASAGRLMSRYAHVLYRSTDGSYLLPEPVLPKKSGDNLKMNVYAKKVCLH